MTGNDVFDLDRFVKAQDPVIATALDELRAGRKQTHWMWFVFPQLRGLGRSPMAQHYGVVNLDEARSYLGHAILRPVSRSALKPSWECQGARYMRSSGRQTTRSFVPR